MPTLDQLGPPPVDWSELARLLLLVAAAWMTWALLTGRATRWGRKFVQDAKEDRDRK